MNTPHLEALNFAPLVTIRATFDAWKWNDESDDPDERGGWVDPSNPWGSFEQDSRDDSAEPESITLPLFEAAEFLKDFPGGVWNYDDGCEAEQNVRTGEYKQVTAHIPSELETIVFAIMDAL